MLIPLCAYLFFVDQLGLAGGVFVIACATDILDGFLARKLNIITTFGQIADPVADKGMMATVIVCMTFYEIIPITACIIIVAKELIMFFGGTLLLQKKIVIQSKWFGKLSTVLTALCVFILLFFHEHIIPPYTVMLQYLPVIMAVFSLGLYSRGFCKLVNKA